MLAVELFHAQYVEEQWETTPFYTINATTRCIKMKDALEHGMYSTRRYGRFLYKKCSGLTDSTGRDE